MPADWREQRLAQERYELRTRKRLAVTEGRGIHTRPRAGAVRNDQQKLAARREHAPDLTQHIRSVRRHLERMHRKHAIDRCIA